MNNADFEKQELLPPAELYLQALPLLSQTIRVACRRLHFWPNAEEDARLAQRLALLLLENDYRWLRQFRQEVPLQTWLQTVTNRYVRHYCRQARRYTTLEAVPPAVFLVAPLQEERIWHSERQGLLREVVAQLTPREQELLRLLCQEELSTEAKAAALGIKRNSFYHEKSLLLKKLRQLVAAKKNAPPRKDS